MKWFTASALPSQLHASASLPRRSNRPDPIWSSARWRKACQGEQQEVQVLTAAIAPGQSTVFHTHRVPVTVYMLEGSFTLEMEGRETVTVRAGQSMVEPPNVRMTGFNRSTTEPVRLVMFHVADPVRRRSRHTVPWPDPPTRSTNPNPLAGPGSGSSPDRERRRTGLRLFDWL